MMTIFWKLISLNNTKPVEPKLNEPILVQFTDWSYKMKGKLLKNEQELKILLNEQDSNNFPPLIIIYILLCFVVIIIYILLILNSLFCFIMFVIIFEPFGYFRDEDLAKTLMIIIGVPIVTVLGWSWYKAFIKR